MFQLPFMDELRSLVASSAIDDATDRLNSFATAFLLIFFAVFISAKTYVGEPIQCWFPSQFEHDWKEYSETLCFVQKTHFIRDTSPLNNLIHVENPDNHVTYYQWSAIFLTLMSLGFIAPKLIWKKAQSKFDIPLLYFCETAAEIKMKSSIEIAEKVREMGNYMKSKLTNRDREMKTKSRLAYTYLVIKLLYVLNILSQLTLVSFFLGHNANLFWGIDIMTNLVGNVTWSDTGIFPRITFCHFTIRTPIIQHHVVQCVLAVNEFNEKIFAFLWVWLILVGIATLIGMVIVLLRLLNYGFINDLLLDTPKKEIVSEFANYLGKDGLLVLLFVSSQSDVVASDLTMFMFDAFLKSHLEKIAEIEKKEKLAILNV
ncbi:unnamed protein product [Caenorhabditis bovis]|uniref:Innexin n=1 Tax=Caenorhabditis bovis TaxID=2654633 RepID=A0A8S1ERY6_9PELO|nr:unnamed protein product [Caenorhabditis bovis]